MDIASPSRSRVFTATWPWSNGNGGLGMMAGADSTRDKYNPCCQVTIRMITGPKPGEAVSEAKADPDADADADSEELSITESETIIFSEVLPLQSYNSFFLAEDGEYLLTLTDCHVRIPGHAAVGAAAMRSARAAAAIDTKRMGEEDATLHFLSLPFSIRFDIDMVPSEAAVIGNFHLLPVIHVLPASHENALDKSSQPPHRRPHEKKLAHATTECERDRGLSGSTIFTSIALLMMVGWWVTVFKGEGRGVLKKMAQVWRYAGWGGRRIVKGGRKRPLLRKGSVRQTSDGEVSDASDSDGILKGPVPDPVGLPRSDEDWRTLFDTLYEQEREEAKNAAASSGSHRNNDVPSAMPNYVVSMSR